MTEERNKYNIEIMDRIHNSHPIIRTYKKITMDLVLFWLNKMESEDKIIIERI